MAFETKGTQTAAGEQAPPDLVRAMLAQMMQAALQAEFDRFIGAGPWERTAERRGLRNGTKRRRLHTRVGTIELRIPKDREGRFQPTLFERYQRSEKAFVLALVEMYIQGVSTRKVQKVVEQLCGVLVSASQVSALVKGLDGQLEAWRKRSRVFAEQFTRVEEKITVRAAKETAWHRSFRLSPIPRSGFARTSGWKPASTPTATAATIACTWR